MALLLHFHWEENDHLEWESNYTVLVNVVNENGGRVVSQVAFQILNNVKALFTFGLNKYC